MFQVAEATKQRNAPQGMEVVRDRAPKDYELNPREILIQCLYRPSEPIHPVIIDSSYTWVDQGCGWQRVMDPFGGWVHISRNWQTQMFLKRKEFKYLLLIDADELVPWWIPFHMAEVMDQNEEINVLSGVVCGFNQQRGLFACVAVKGGDGKAHFPSLAESKCIPAQGIQEVDNAGTGCLMIRRSVLEKMWLKYQKDNNFGQPFSIPEAEQNQAAIQGALPRGEDICFTDRLRKLGYKVHVDWACKIGHNKPFPLIWPADRITQMDPEKWAKLAWPEARGRLKTVSKTSSPAKKKAPPKRKPGTRRGKSAK